MAPIKPKAAPKDKAKKTLAAGVQKSVASILTSKAAAKPVIVANKSSSKKEKAEKPIFEGKKICSIGVYKRNDKAISHDDIARWVKYYAGEYVKELTEDTTHLICSIPLFESAMQQTDGTNVGHYEKMVQRAQRLGKQRCQIVVYDWLEDCLNGKKKAKKLLNCKNYTLDRVMNRLAQGLKITAEFSRRFEEGVRSCHEMVDNNLYHVSTDATGFEYKVVLTRSKLVTVEDKSKQVWEKYTLYLYESHARPHVYMVGAKLSRTNHNNSLWRDYCHPMDYPTAFKYFQHFFHDKTGVLWDDRLEPQPDVPKEFVPKKRASKKALTNEELLELQAPAPLPEIDLSAMRFRYIRPQRPRPLGLLPYDYILPEDRDDYVAPKQLVMAPDPKVDFDLVEKIQQNPTQTGNAHKNGIPKQHVNQRNDEGNRQKLPKKSAGRIGSNENPIVFDSDSEVEPDMPEEDEDESDDEDDHSPVQSVSDLPSHSTHFSTLRTDSNNTSSGQAGRSASDQSLDSGTSSSASFHTSKSHLSSQISSGSHNKSRSQDTERGGVKEQDVIIISDSDGTAGSDEDETENTPISSKYRKKSREQNQSKLQFQASKPMRQPSIQAPKSTFTDTATDVSYAVQSPDYEVDEDENEQYYEAEDSRDPMDYDSQLDPQNTPSRAPSTQSSSGSRPQYSSSFNTGFYRTGPAGGRSGGFQPASTSHYNAQTGHWQARGTIGGHTRPGESYGGHPKQNPAPSQQEVGIGGVDSASFGGADEAEDGDAF